VIDETRPRRIFSSIPRNPSSGPGSRLSSLLKSRSASLEASQDLRQQSQGRDMTWSYSGEMATVNGGDLRYLQSLRQCDHRGIDQSQLQIVVGFDQLRGAIYVLNRQIHQFEFTSRYRRQERGLTLRTEVFLHVPACFGQHGHREKKPIEQRGKQPRGHLVMGIGSVNRGVQNAGIQQGNRHEGRSNPSRRTICPLTKQLVMPFGNITSSRGPQADERQFPSYGFEVRILDKPGELRVGLHQHAQTPHPSRRKPVDKVVHVLVVMGSGHDYECTCCPVSEQGLR